jgi:hypothetical protein
MADELLETIKQRIVTGEHEWARLQLVEYLRTASDDVDAWALLASLVKEPEEQLECYRQILRIDPGNRQAAVWIDSLESLSPASISETPGDEPVEQGPKLHADPLDETLAGLDLPSIEEEVARQIGKPAASEHSGVASSQSPPQTRREPSALAGLLGRLSSGRGPEVRPELLEEDALSGGAPVALTPDEILKLAGGPLPEEERKKCPACGAVVSRTETRCAWCSSPLPAE